MPLNQRRVSEYYRNTYWLAGGLPPSEWQNQEAFINGDRANGQFAFLKDEFGALSARSASPVVTLEIGAGQAYFSRLLLSKFPGTLTAKVVELGQGWREYYAAVGLKFFGETLPVSSTETFDLVHASHWLEHVVDLGEVLTTIRGMVKEEGLLFLEVPNCNDAYYLMDSGDSPHVHFFTESSLRRTVELFGFQVLHSGEFGHNQFELALGIRQGSALSKEGSLSERNSSPRDGGQYLRILCRKL